MQPHQRRALGGLGADDQRDMFAQVIAGTESDDLGRIASRHRQVRATGHDQMRGILPCHQVGRSDRLGLARHLGQHQESRQDPRQPRQRHRGARCLRVGQSLGAERAFEGMDQIERRVGDDQRLSKVERFGPANQHRGFGDRRGALVGQLERCGTGRRDQHHRRGEPGREAGFGGEQRQRIVDDHRPAMAQCVECQRDPPWRPAQTSNSVINGT